MAYRIDEIEGIGPVFREKLAAAGIETTDQFLTACASANGRKKVSAEIGLTEQQLLKWANMADMMRIKGIGRQNSELLHAAGVDTVKELRNRKAENLAPKIAEVNGEKKLAKTNPSSKVVEDWIVAANELEPVITH